MGRKPKASNADRSGGPVAAELRLIGGLTELFFDFLAAVVATGSISQAARKIGISYKSAWDMLDRANNLSPRALVATEIGGRQGGGAYLTPTGQKLLALFLRIKGEHRRFLQELNAALLADGEFREFFQRLSVRASARNQLSGRILAVERGAGDARVVLATKGGERLVAALTARSADGLGLETGKEAMALVKAHAVMVVKAGGGYRLSAHNQLRWEVERIQTDSVNTKVVIRLPEGDSLAAIVTEEGLARMDLNEGDPAMAVFEEEDVVLAVLEP